MPDTSNSCPAASAAGDLMRVDDLVDATPAHRDRYVDLLRALSIVVVVLWHWVFSVTHWSAEGRLVMPNPIDRVPGLWAATWVLQIMPVFFLVGGYANLAALEAARRRGEGPAGYLRGRLRRLLRPVVVFVVTVGVVDVLVRLASPGTPSVLTWGMVVFVPLWFLGVYLAVVVASPLTAAAHRRWGPWVLVALAAATVVCDGIRLAGGPAWIGLSGSAAVWLFAHQLGYWWRSGGLVQRGRSAVLAVAGVGLVTLVVLTGSGLYPRSMVSERGQASNMFPTSAAIAALAVFQLGLVLLARPAATRLLARRAVWKATVAANGVAMTVFCWHMVALVAAIGSWHLVGGGLGAEADASWWSTRPLWVLLPGAALAVLVAVFARVELPRTAPAGR